MHNLVTTDRTRHFATPDRWQVRVVRILEKSAASVPGGLRVGDVLLSVNDQVPPTKVFALDDVQRCSVCVFVQVW
jgi:hypothetical protein